ncbi:MAG: glutaredoxin [Pseudomonadota bacterium]
MSRALLDETQIHPAIRNRLSSWHQSIVREVQAAVSANDVVVVGMGINPFVKKARKALDQAGIAFNYLEYGNYFSLWRERTALKMWTGWPTLPMVFVRGTLIGGATDLEKLIASGELKTLLAK